MLINCVAYQNGIKLADLPVEKISDYLGRPDCFVWVALRDTTEEELNKMQEEFGLHDLAVEDAHHAHQRLLHFAERRPICGKILPAAGPGAGQEERGRQSLNPGRRYIKI